MNCEDYWNDIGQPAPDAGFGAHLARCPACEARYAAGNPLEADVRLLATEMKHVSAPPRLEARLLRAYRERYSLRVPAAREVRRWWAAAAAVVLAAGALWMGARPPLWQPLVASNSPLASVAGVDEQDAAFIPLPNAAGSPQDDDVDLVRVELPRSAITAVGIPAGDDGGSGSVEAEVLVGPDGMARAVRFLN